MPGQWRRSLHEHTSAAGNNYLAPGRQGGSVSMSQVRVGSGRRGNTMPSGGLDLGPFLWQEYTWYCFSRRSQKYPFLFQHRENSQNFLRTLVVRHRVPTQLLLYPRPASSNSSSSCCKYIRCPMAVQLQCSSMAVVAQLQCLQQ